MTPTTALIVALAAIVLFLRVLKSWIIRRELKRLWADFNKQHHRWSN